MRCLNPVRITKNLDIEKFPHGLLVPCGQCMNCRLQRREEWVVRLWHEFEFWDDSIFITLTYNEDNLPEKASLKKSDLQKFFKRLRKRLNGKPIKYFACGEYGEENGRPHYHCIIFGLSRYNNEDIKFIRESWDLCDWDFQKKSGSFGEVNPTSIRYVVGYLEKIITGKQEEYAYVDIEIPFTIVSKGIGEKYCKKYKEKIDEMGYITINGNKKSIPRYYSDKAGIKREKLQEAARTLEMDKVFSILGVRMNRDEVYLTQKKDDILKIEDRLKCENKQHDLNLRKQKELKTRRKSS